MAVGNLARVECFWTVYGHHSYNHNLHLCTFPSFFSSCPNVTDSSIKKTTTKTSSQTTYKTKNKEASTKSKTKKKLLADVLEEEEDENENITVHT